MPAARSVRHRTLAGPAAIVLILCAGVLAGCSGASLPFSKATDAPPARTPPAIYVSTITGLPAGQEKTVFQALVRAAAQRGIALGGGRVEAEFTLVGAFEEVATDTGMAMRYRWTLADPRGRVLHRIDEIEPSGSSRPPEPGGIPVHRIAAATAENLSSRLSQLGYATRVAGMPPPLDHLAQAGPGAEAEIDFETLHGTDMASVPAPGVTVPTPAPGPAKQDGDKPAAAANAGPSIEGVAITGVTGAGKTGNQELASALERVLSDAGWPVLPGPRGDVLTIQGDVSVGQPVGKAQNVALRWTVTAPDGAVIGAIEQGNDVPAGSLDDGWGEAADHAALAAAQGIFELVDKLR